MTTTSTTTVKKEPESVFKSLLTKEQIEALRSDIPPEDIRKRGIGGGREAQYVKKEYLIATLHKIFGIENVSRETTEIRLVDNSPTITVSTGQGPDVQRDSYTSTWMCKCRLTIRIPHETGDKIIVVEGVGADSHTVILNTNVYPAHAMENAIKGAESDSLKRACINLGRRFGNEIDDQEIAKPILTESQKALQANNARKAAPATNQTAKDSAQPVTTKADTTTKAPQSEAAKPAATKNLATETGTSGWGEKNPFDPEPTTSEGRNFTTEQIDAWDRETWVNELRSILDNYRKKQTKLDEVIHEVKQLTDYVVNQTKLEEKSGPPSQKLTEQAKMLSLAMARAKKDAMESGEKINETDMLELNQNIKTLEPILIYNE